ncbi:histidine phosphatase family protein [Planktotalea sp.]|uniref:histidine phosphatase family protein n=1 Tax=Planktotalea sp. TaxID=2029877 RepID=UPI003D6BBAEA
MVYPTIYLMRHGQTEWNVASRLQGRLDSPLTSQGRAQAQRQGELLASLSDAAQNVIVYASPQGRAQETAKIALKVVGAAHQTDERLREISAGSWDGSYLDEIEQRHGNLFEQARNAFELMFLAPDGEGELSVLARCKSMLADIREPTLLITHGATLCVLRGLLRGLEFEDMLDLSHEQGCIYVIEKGEEKILR